MQKKVLSEQALYYGNVKMPKHWEIDRNDLAHHILHSNLTNKKLQFSKTLSKLNTYLIDFNNLENKIALVNKNAFGKIYNPNEISPPLLNIDPIDLKNSPDFTMLYGVKVKDCFVRIYYENNRHKGNSWDIELTDNKFIMFPSTNMYVIFNNQKENLNFIQTITYEHI
tara:strand:- start:256 stop:759 length:504 start_codon:yes stop_codon:yes gene_type:complete